MSFVRASKQVCFLALFLLGLSSLHAQKLTQKELELKKASIKKELKEINALLFTNKQKKVVRIVNGKAFFIKIFKPLVRSFLSNSYISEKLCLTECKKQK